MLLSYIAESAFSANRGLIPSHCILCPLAKLHSIYLFSICLESSYVLKINCCWLLLAVKSNAGKIKVRVDIRVGFRNYLVFPS